MAPPTPVYDSNGEIIGWNYPDPFEDALAKTSRDFQQTARQVRSSIAARDNLIKAQDAISQPGLTLAQRGQKLQDLGFAADGIKTITAQIEGGNGSAAVASLQAQANSIAVGIQTDYDRLVSIDPPTTFDLFPHAMADSSRLKFARSLMGVGGDGAAPQNTVQVVKDETTGKSYVYTFGPNGNLLNKQDLGTFDFAKIDPERKFRQDVLASAATVEANLASLDLQQRGMIIKALGDDLATQVLVGNMQYTEANLDLSRASTAFDQRRKEREQMLKFVVAKSSVRTLPSGEQVTALPGGAQLAGILSNVTGMRFDPSVFDLPVTYSSPDQTGQDVMNASAFTSPIPGIAASMSQSRSMIENILGKPLGSAAASQQLLAAAMPPQ